MSTEDHVQIDVEEVQEVEEGKPRSRRTCCEKFGRCIGRCYEVMEFIYDVGTFFFDIWRMLRDVVQEIVDDLKN